MCISEKRRRWITGAERKINLLPSVSRSPFWFIWQNKPRGGRRCTLVFVSPVYDIVVIPRLETNRRPLRMTDHRYVITRICTLQTFCSVPKIVPTDISRARVTKERIQRKNRSMHKDYGTRVVIGVVRPKFLIKMRIISTGECLPMDIQCFVTIV